MAEQSALFEAEVVPTNPRQQLVLRRLREAGTDGLEASEAGAWAHTLTQGRWRHSEQERCLYCGRDGLGILQRLKGLGLARYRGRLRVWQAVGVEDSSAPLPGQLRDDQPLPF